MWICVTGSVREPFANCRQTFFDNIQKHIQENKPVLDIAQEIVRGVFKAKNHSSGGDVRELVNVTKQLQVLFDKQTEKEKPKERSAHAKNVTELVCVIFHFHFY